MCPTFHCNLTYIFFYCNFYIGLYMAKNINRTAKMQWKVDTIKKCIYLQCRSPLEWRTFQKFDQLCEKVSESGNQERCCQTDRQTSTRRSIIWGEHLHFAGLRERESMKSYFWNRLNFKSK